MRRLGHGLAVHNRGASSGGWFNQPAYAGMIAIADFNHDRYALPAFGTELISNGSFNTDLTAWAFNAPAGGASTTWDSAGVAKLQGDGVNTANLRQPVSTIVGVLYELTFTNVNRVDSYAGTTAGGTDVLPALPYATSGTWKRYFVAQTTTTYISWLYPTALSSFATIDNVSVKEVRIPTEKITNGTFDTDLSGWNNGSIGTGTAVFSSGACVITATDGSNRGMIDQNLVTVVGARYEVSYDQIVGTQFVVDMNGVSFYSGTGGAGRKTFTFTAIGTSTNLRWRLGGNLGTNTLDNVSVREVPVLRPATRGEWFSQYTAASTTQRSYVDSTGVLKNDLAANAPRFDYTNGKQQLLLENTSTNNIQNNTMQGAVAGSPGTLPNNWSGGNLSGTTRTIVGTGTEDGITYIDVRFSGSATASGTQGVMNFENAANTAATNGQVWTGSMFVKLVGGDLQNVLANTMTVSGRDSGGGLLTATQIPFTPTSAWQRVINTTTLNNVSIAQVLLRYDNSLATGTVDFTLRFGLPQLELQSFATSPIKTTSAAVTRAIETFRLPAIVEAILARAEGGVVVRTDLNMNQAGSVGRRLVGMDTTNALIFAPSTDTQVAAFNGTLTLGVTIPSSGKNYDPLGAAMAFDATGRAIAVNGSTAASDANVVGAHTTFYLGRDTTPTPSAIGTSYGDGRYDFLGIFASRPSNAQLQALAVPAT